MTDAGQFDGWRGFWNFWVVFGAMLPAAGIGIWVTTVDPGLSLERMLTAAVTLVGLLLAFGIGYARDALPLRIARYGLDREANAGGMVSLFFLMAVLTVIAILAFLALPEQPQSCPFGPCTVSLPFNGEGSVEGSASLVLVPERILGGLATVGTAVTVAGFAQLFLVMLRPPTLHPESPEDKMVVRRPLARAVDMVFLSYLIFWVLPHGFRFVDWVGLSENWTLWALFVVFLLVSLAYESVPVLLFQGSVGKLVFGLRLATTTGQTLKWWVVLKRSLCTSLLFSLGTTHVMSLLNDWPRNILAWHLAAAVSLGIMAPLLHVNGRGILDIFAHTRVVSRRAKPGDDSGTRREKPDVRWLRLRPEEFTAEPQSPFAKDLLDRREDVEALANTVLQVSGTAVVLVDAPWGGGKTAFLRMCSAYLQSQGVRVAQFNAWTDQHTQRPLVDLVGAISKQVPDPQAKQLVRNAAMLTKFIIPSDGDQSVAPQASGGLGDSWTNSSEAINNFKMALSAAKGDDDRLIVTIDELDRCHPTYALQTLAAVHHLFAVPGVVVLLGINRDGLCHSVESVYGQGFDADSYLRRFSELQHDIPPPTPPQLSPFLDQLLQDTGLNERLRAPAEAKEILRLVTDLNSCTLRDLQQATRIAGLVLTQPAPEDHPPRMWELSVLALILLRMANQDAYYKFVNDRFSSLQALASANSSFPTYPRTKRPPDEPYPRIAFEASLLSLGFEQRWVTENKRNFIREYQGAHNRPSGEWPGFGGTGDDAEAVLDKLIEIRSLYREPYGLITLQPASVARLIDRIAIGEHPTTKQALLLEENRTPQ